MEERTDAGRSARRAASSTFNSVVGDPPDAGTRNRSNQANTIVSSGPQVAPAMPLTASQILTGPPPVTATLRSVARRRVPEAKPFAVG